MTAEPESLSLEESPLWDAIHARLDGEHHRGVFVAPMESLLDQIRERVDAQAWPLILQLEMRAGLEVMAGVQIGLELGYERGRAAALVESQRVPSGAADVLSGRLVDLLADTSIDYPDVMLALLTALQTTVTLARGEQPDQWPSPRPRGRRPQSSPELETPGHGHCPGRARPHSVRGSKTGLPTHHDVAG